MPLAPKKATLFHNSACNYPAIIIIANGNNIKVDNVNYTLKNFMASETCCFASCNICNDISGVNGAFSSF